MSTILKKTVDFIKILHESRERNNTRNLKTTFEGLIKKNKKECHSEMYSVLKMYGI